MKKIYLLQDYKGNFGLKYDSIPYRSGMDKHLLNQIFKQYGYDAKYLKFPDVDPRDPLWKNALVLYTSQEDKNNYYKSYIEDVILALELNNAIVIPKYKYLRAHNNKVFMEMIHEDFGVNSRLKTMHFGTYSELKDHHVPIKYPIVLKSYAGAMSKNVFLAHNKKEIHQLARKISNTKSLSHDLKEFLRVLKYKNYFAESKFRRKFVMQEFVPGLDSDWKVLIFGHKYYVFKRPTRRNDFRASGSGNKSYKYAIPPPEGLLDLAELYKNKLHVPFLSLDILFNGSDYFISEYQVINFGTVGQLKSDGYFVKKIGKWEKTTGKIPLEKVYVDAVVDFISENYE